MKKIYRALGIEKGEESSVMLLLIQSLFMGIFLATYDVGSTALFLDAFPAEMLPKSFIVSGIVGMILSIIYSKLQQIISFVKLAIINLVLIVAIVFSIRYAFEVTDTKWLAFLVFIMMGPLNALALLGFWGVAGRLFSIRQAKRLFGMIDSGQIFGMILTSFLIPLVLYLSPSVNNLLLLSGLSILGTLVIQIIISKKFGKGIIQKEKEEAASKVAVKVITYVEMFKEPYIRMLALFVITFMIGAFLVYGAFMGVVKTNFPDQIDTANFLSIFTAVVMIFTFIIKTFLFARLMSTYGLKLSLLLSPVVVGILIVLAAVVGTILGYELEAKGFVFFFLLISLGRLFSHSLSMAIQAPTLNILYQPLASTIRYDVQAKINGTINELSSVLSGFILLGLGSLSFFKPIYVPYLLVVIFVVWVWVIISLYNEYQNTLKKSLESSDDYHKELGTELEILSKEVRISSSANKIIHILRVISDLHPILYEDLLMNCIHHRFADVRKYTIKMIGEIQLIQAIDKLQEQLLIEKDIVIKNYLEEVLSLIYQDDEDYLSNSYLEQLVYSRKIEHRVYATKLLALFVNNKNSQYLVDLIRDIEPPVRWNAIVTAGQVNRSELYPFLIDNLSNNRFYSPAKAALIHIGEPVVQDLKYAFNRSGTNIHLLENIINVLMIIGGNEVNEYLVANINYPEPIIQKSILNALVKSDVLVNNDVYRDNVKQVLKQFIGSIYWNKMALSEIKIKYIGDDLKHALEQENTENYEQVFSLLGILFDANSIQKIQQDIEIGTTESVGYAIELLDLLLDEYLKQHLFPILEDLSISEMTRQLQNYFPRENFDAYRVLIEIINRDYNLIGKWTKACAIEALHKMEKVQVSYALTANMFNPDRLLNEQTAKLLKSIDKDHYQEVLQRVEEKQRQNLQTLLDTKTDQTERFLMWKVRYLKELPQFSIFSWTQLQEIAKYMKYYLINEDVNLWNQEENYTPNIFLIEGEVMINKGGRDEHLFNHKGLIGNHELWEDEFFITKLFTKTKVKCFMIEEDDWKYLINHYHTLAKVYVNLLDQVNTDKKREWN